MLVLGYFLVFSTQNLYWNTHRSYNFCVKTSLRLLLQHDYLKLFRVRVDLTNLSKQCKSQEAEIFCVENVFIRFKCIYFILLQWLRTPWLVNSVYNLFHFARYHITYNPPVDFLNVIEQVTKITEFSVNHWIFSVWSFYH